MEEISEEEFRRNFGKIVRELRQEQGISQEELADRSKLHRTYISEIERGLKTVSVLSLFHLAKGLEVPAYAIIKKLETPEK